MKLLVNVTASEHVDEDGKRFVPSHYEEMEPLDILFSQDSCYYWFRDRWSLAERFTWAMTDRSQCQPYPPIRVVANDQGQYITHDNRRLLLYQWL